MKTWKKCISLLTFSAVSITALAADPIPRGAIIKNRHTGEQIVLTCSELSPDGKCTSFSFQRYFPSHPEDAKIINKNFCTTEDLNNFSTNFKESGLAFKKPKRQVFGITKFWFSHTIFDSLDKNFNAGAVGIDIFCIATAASCYLMTGALDLVTDVVRIPFIAMTNLSIGQKNHKAEKNVRAMFVGKPADVDVVNDSNFRKLLEVADKGCKGKANPIAMLPGKQLDSFASMLTGVNQDGNIDEIDRQATDLISKHLQDATASTVSKPARGQDAGTGI